MNFPMMIECTYEDGTVAFTYSSKYMRTQKGRPVKVVVHGEATVPDWHTIKNSAHRDAQIEYLNPVVGAN